LKEKRRIFDTKLNEEIKNFGKRYNDMIVIIFQRFSDFVRKLTNAEMQILNQINDIKVI